MGIYYFSFNFLCDQHDNNSHDFRKKTLFCSFEARQLFEKNLFQNCKFRTSKKHDRVLYKYRILIMWAIWFHFLLKKKTFARKVNSIWRTWNNQSIKIS